MVMDNGEIMPLLSEEQIYRLAGLMVQVVTAYPTGWLDELALQSFLSEAQPLVQEAREVLDNRSGGHG